MDAPYTGGFQPGGRIFAIDGDQTIASPCGPPHIYNPLPGDSVPSVYPIILLDRSIDPPDYVSVDVGTGFNVQDFAASQAAICIEQEFQVAEAFHTPLPLNTLYDPAWSVGWGNNYVDLGNCFLVEEGPLQGIGGGLVRFVRKFASLPPNRNEFESHNATFPALNDGSDSPRFGFSRVANSRLFYEYFVYDNLNLLPGIELYPAGKRINTGVNGPDVMRYICFEEFKGFKPVADAVVKNNLLDPDQPLQDDDGSGNVTTPSYSTYASWQYTSEIVAEASSFNRYMGNIFVRKTRFVLAQ